MAKLGDLVVRIGANTTNFNAKLGALKSQIRKDTKNIAAMGRNMSMGITAPLVAIGATSFKVAADFEQSMAKVKAVSGATGDEFKKLQDNAKELGRTTRFTASEVSALQLEYAKLGFSADEITQVTGATLNLAQATGSDLAQSAEVAGATLRAFGLNASETERVTDVMAASFSSSALDINSFQDSMKFVAPVAKAAGVSLEEATAMLGQLANNGIKGSNAGTSLRRILQEVAGTGQPFSEAMKMSADEVINLADAKDEVGRSASSAFLVLKEGMGDVAGLTTELQGAEGAAAGMAAIMDDTAQGAMKRMQSAIEGAQIEIGTALAPTMIKLAGIVADLAQKFSEMSDGGKGLVFALTAVAGGIGPVLMVLPNLLKGIRLARLAFAALNRTMLANPFGAVAVAIGLVVGALISMNNASSEGSSKVDNLKKSLGGLGLEEQKQAIENTTTAQKALIAELEAEKKAVEAIPKYKRNKYEIPRLTKEIAAANADLEAMQSLSAGVDLKIKAAAESTNEAGAEIDLLGNNASTAATDIDALNKSVETATKKINDKSKTLGFLINQLEEVPNENIWQPIDKGAKATTQTLGELMTMLEETPVTTFGEEINTANTFLQAMTDTATTFGNIIGSAFASMISGAKSGKEAMKEMAKAIISAALAASQASIIEAMINSGKFTGPAAPIVIPALVASGVALVSGLFSSLPAFADGGIVSGPTMGLIGEYPGAKTNPEVIAPLDKLRSMMGGQNVVVTGKISGRDILLTSERNAIDRNRVRGF